MKNRLTYAIRCRAMTLVEVMVSVAIMGVALAMTMQLLVGTSQHIDMEIKESDLAKRTTSRLAAMMTEIENITATNDVNFTISNQGGSPPSAPSISPAGTSTITKTPIALVTPATATLGFGQDGYVLSTQSSRDRVVGNCITFRIPTGTYQGAVVWAPNTPPPADTATALSTGTSTGTGTGTGNPNLVQTIRYRWAPMSRNGVVNSTMGMLVREVLDYTGQVISFDAVEENIPVCDYTWDPSATPAKLPLGFSVVQAAVESNGAGVQAVQRLRTLTITIQRVSNTNSTITGIGPGGSALTGGTYATATASQTVFLKTP